METLSRMRHVPLLLALSLAIIVAAATSGLAAQPTVNLGTTSGFAVLAGSTITNTGPTTINGDVGLYPGTSFTGQASVTLNGALHVNDAVASVAQDDLVTAYDDAAGRTPVTRIPTELGGTVLTPGVYDSAAGTFQITGPLTLDAQGNPNAVFIFKTSSTLITASNSSVNLINGARFCRIFWQVGSSATLGTDSQFVGHILAMTSITANTGATVEGQLMARNGAVTLDTNTITNEVCTDSTTAVAVTKTLAPGQDAVARVGDPVSYVIGVTNSGDTTLTTVPLTDTFDSAHLDFVSASPSPDSVAAGTLTWNDLTGAGQLAPGQTLETTVTFTAVLPGGSVTNTGTVIGATDVDENIAPTSWGTAELAITNPHVHVAKNLAPGQSSLAPVGGTVTYEIVVTNDGDTTLTIVPLTDTFDSAHLDFVSASPGPDSTSAGTLTWNDLTGAGQLAPSESVTVTVTFAVTAAAESVPDTATVSGAVDVNDSAVNDSEATNSTVGTYELSSLQVTKTADPASGTIVVPGQTIEYRIGYANNSLVTVPAAALVDTLSPAVTYVPGTLTLNGAPIPDTGNYDPLTRSIDVSIGPIPPQSSGELTFQVTVGPKSVSRAGIMNVGSWTASGTVVATTTPVYHYVESLDITKGVRSVSGSAFRTGSVLLWTIVVTNRGIVPATNVVVSDRVPAHTTYVRKSITGPGGSDSHAPALVWNVGTIAVGRRVTLTFKSSINGRVANGTLISNRAFGQADQSPLKGSTARGGRVNDATTVVVRTSGAEYITLGLMGLLGVLSLGSAWHGRPSGGTAGRRGSRITTAVLLSAMLALGGMEVGAAFGMPLPSPGEAVAGVAQTISTASGGGTTSAVARGSAPRRRVILPTIGVRRRLVEGRSMRALARGVWHQPPSVMPGRAGACVIAGHRTSSQFARLHRLRVGARVWVVVGRHKYKYRVASVSTRRASGAVLGFRTGTRQKLILYTCTPRWQGNKRTVVVCYRTRR